MLKDALERIHTIAESLPDDDPDKLGMMNIDGDYEALIEWALKRRLAAMCNENSCNEAAEIYKKRASMFSNQKERMGEVVKMLMNAAGEKKYKGVSGTATIRAVAPKPIITDEALVPEAYKKIAVSIDKTAINKAVKDGEAIPGVALDNGGETISIRTK